MGALLFYFFILFILFLEGPNMVAKSILTILIAVILAFPHFGYADSVSQTNPAVTQEQIKTFQKSFKPVREEVGQVLDTVSKEGWTYWISENGKEKKFNVNDQYFSNPELGNVITRSPFIDVINDSLSFDGKFITKNENVTLSLKVYKTNDKKKILARTNVLMMSHDHPKKIALGIRKSLNILSHQIMNSKHLKIAKNSLSKKILSILSPKAHAYGGATKEQWKLIFKYGAYASLSVFGVVYVGLMIYGLGKSISQNVNAKRYFLIPFAPFAFRWFKILTLITVSTAALAVPFSKFVSLDD